MMTELWSEPLWILFPDRPAGIQLMLRKDMAIWLSFLALFFVAETAIQQNANK